MMDDQGAGGSLRGSGTNPHRQPVRESSLPPTLLQHLYHAPRHPSSPRIAPLIAPGWPSQPTRPRSQNHGRSLPSPSHLLRQTESTFDYDQVILSRSLDASPVGPVLATNPNLPPPRLVPERSLPLAGNPVHSTRDHSTGWYPPLARSMSTLPYEPRSRPYSHAPPYGHGLTSWSPQPPQPPPFSRGPRRVHRGRRGVTPARDTSRTSSGSLCGVGSFSRV
jgi:hypothetical protein